MPSRLLAVLIVTFGGALGLKAMEERRSADTALAAQQAREAMAVGGYVRSELARAQSTFETALMSGKNPRDAAAMAKLSNPVSANASNTVLGELGGQNRVKVFARDPSNRWWSAEVSTDTLLPAETVDRRYSLRHTSIAPSGTSINRQTFETRNISSCAPISESAISACAEREPPSVWMGRPESDFDLPSHHFRACSCYLWAGQNVPVKR